MLTTIDVVVTEILSPHELNQLARLEECVMTGFKAFFGGAGQALGTIKKDKLYRQAGTWEDYCLGKWGMSTDGADNLINASLVLQQLTEAEIPTIVGILPMNESQCRPLAKLPPEKRVSAWLEAVKTAPEGKVTAKHIEGIAEAERLSYDRNYRYAKAEEMYVLAIRGGVKIPKRNGAKAVFVYWEQEKKKTLSERQKAILQEDVEIFCQEFIRDSQEEHEPIKSVGAVGTSTKEPTESGREIWDTVSALNAYEPDDLAIALKRMDEKYMTVVSISILPLLSPDIVAQTCQGMGMGKQEAKAISDATYKITVAIDAVFEIPVED